MFRLWWKSCVMLIAKSKVNKMKLSKLQESGLKKIVNKLSEGDRDTTWLVKNIEQFISKNEGQDQDSDFGGSIQLKLYGKYPSPNLNITLDELKAFVKLLKRM